MIGKSLPAATTIITGIWIWTSEPQRSARRLVAWKGLARRKQRDAGSMLRFDRLRTTVLTARHRALT
jgi:hypothetical protein